MDVDEPSAPFHGEPLAFQALASAHPVYVLKLGQGTVLEQLRKCSHSNTGAPTITFQKDSLSISIPSDQGVQVNQFRIAPEEQPPLLVHHDSQGWHPTGYITAKLHPKDWNNPAPAQVEETIIMTPKDIIQTKKTSASETPAKRSRSKKPISPPEPPKHNQAMKGPAKVSSIQKKPQSHARSKQDDSDSESDDSDSAESNTSPLRARQQQIPSKKPASHMPPMAEKRPPGQVKNLPMPPMASKKPRTTVVPVPQQKTEPVDDESHDDDEDDLEEDSVDQETDKLDRNAPTNRNFPPIASKRPRAAATVPMEVDSNPPASSPPATHHLHSITPVPFSADQLPDVSKDINNYDDFEYAYRKYKEVWPVYIQLHGELAKNRADFHTLQKTIEQFESEGKNTAQLQHELQNLYKERYPIIDPMRATYLKLNKTMHILRRQLESYSNSTLGHVTSPNNGNS